MIRTFIDHDLIPSFIGAIDCKPVPMGEQIVGALVGGGGSYVRDWKVVRLYAFDKFKLGAVRHKFVVGIRNHEQAQTRSLGAVRHWVGIRCGAFSGNMKVSLQAARSIG